MGIANKFNNGVVFNYQTPEGLGYASLEDLIKANGENKKYTVHALYINTKGKFGDQPLAITDEAQVNFPSHLLNTVKEIRQDAEAIEAINNNKLGFEIYGYPSEKYGTCYSVRWIDL